MKRSSCCHSVGNAPGGSGSLTTIEPILPAATGLQASSTMSICIARHRHAGRAVFHRQLAEAHRIAGDAPAGLGLPPVIDHRHFQQILRPLDGRRVGALAGQEQRAEFRQVVLLEQLAVRVFLADGAERGRRGEQRRPPVLGDDAPERAGIGRADRLALVEDRGAAVEQRRVDDVGMADHPADVGGRPPHLAGIDAVEILHRPFQRDHVAAIVAHHAFGHAGGAGGVEDVERIGGGDRHAVRGLGVFDRVLPGLAPVVVAAFDRASPRLAGAAGSGRLRACAWRARWPRRAAACRG